MSRATEINNKDENKKGGISRRKFLEYSGATIVGTALGTKVFAKNNDPHVKPETGMKYRRLGRTNFMISEIGLGTASGSLSRQLGPFLFSKWLMERGVVINKLLDLGGNFVSTSVSYHNTVELLGNACKDRRNEVYFAIGVPGEEKLREKFEEALKNLHTDYIDLGFLHGGGNEEEFETIHKLKAEGKIRFVGQSCHNPRMHEWAIRNNYLDWMHIPYNRLSMIKQGSSDITGIERAIKLAKDNDVGVITIKAVTGNYIPYWARQTNEPEIQEIMKKLKDYGPQNLYQAMIRWILQNPNLTACVVGMDTVQQVIENVEAVVIRDSYASSIQDELLEDYARLADKDYCRLCETCTPHCPKGIPISDILRFRMYHDNYGHKEYAVSLYNELPNHKKVTECDKCGICEGHCPHNLAIVEKLHQAHWVLSQNKSLLS